MQGWVDAGVGRPITNAGPSGPVFNNQVAFGVVPEVNHDNLGAYLAVLGPSDAVVDGRTLLPVRSTSS